ncbi:MAG: TonB-dependent siderophore receptor [Alphaproteobacteria bacterium]|nr:MAG: TonB-dependent siderophore receptor [Alphaproteobacteria bacterium]
MSNFPFASAVVPRLIAQLIPLASAACLCCDTWAQENQPEAEVPLPTITVQGARKSAPKASTAPKASRASTGLLLTPRETPQSVSSVEREQIEQRSLTSVDMVLRSTTGIHVSFYDTQRPLYYSRGFLITDFQVDGLPTFSNSTNQEFDTALYERVEIVRGANGILTGVGTPSATINLIRKRPKPIFGGTASVSVGSWDYYRGELDLNVPLNDDGSVRSRWVIAPQKRHGFRDRYQEDKYALLGVVEADLGRSTVASVGYQRQKNDPTAGVWGTIPRFTSDGGLANLPESTNFSPSWTRWSRESGTLFATVDHQFNSDWSLKASLNHTEGKTFSLRTYASGPFVGGTIQQPFPDRATGAGINLYAAVSGGNETQDTLDARLSGQFKLGGRKHDLSVGVSSLRTDNVTDGYTNLASGSTRYIYTIPNVFNWDGSASYPVYGRNGNFTEQKTSQDAVYGSARWRLAEPLSLLTGARFTNWRRQTDTYTAPNGAFGVVRQQVEREPSPFLGVVYDLGQNLSAYASHTGIFNPQNYKDRDGHPLDPVKGTSDEVGIKGEWPVQGLSGSFAFFQVKQDNYGVRDSSVPPNTLDNGTASAYVGVDGTSSFGWEADVAARLTSNWQATAGVTRVSTKRHALDLTYANLPEWLVKLGTQYRFSGALQPIEVGAQLLWQGRMDAVNVPSPSGPTMVTQSPFGLLNLNASWRFSESTSVNLAVNNALDKRYWATLDYANYGEPRFASLTLRTRF